MDLKIDLILDDVASLQGIAQLFVKELNVEVPSIETDLIETGILDSLTFLELLVQIEKRFSIKVCMEELDIESFRSIPKIVAFVRDHAGKG
jgi:methoxymalonate biosynthesis acyl carrier protein